MSVQLKRSSSTAKAIMGNQSYSIDSGRPVLFLPVRFETRFVDLSDGTSELWIRVFPDQIMVNSFEPELTSQEVKDGDSYWSSKNAAGGTVDLQQSAWKLLASRYGPPRAAWIASQTNPNPTNSAHPGTRTGSWTKAATAEALPDYWNVVAFTGDNILPAHGSPISAPLAVGLDPRSLQQGSPPFPPGSPVDEGMQWLVDFDCAVKKGMALRIRLDSKQRSAGFDRIFVYGLRTQDKSGSDTFGRLLDWHHYTDGVAFVPQGSNLYNTPDAPSAYSRKDPDYATSFKVEAQDPLITGDDKYIDKDGYQFATLLDIDVSTLGHIQYADSTGIRNGTDMLRALWPATLDYFLRQIMYDPRSATGVDVNALRGYVLPSALDCVNFEVEARLGGAVSKQGLCLANGLARGPIPNFRVGRTLYGVVPVTSLRLYGLSPDTDPHTPAVEPPLVNLLRRLWPTWLESAKRAPHMTSTGNPDQELASVLGMDASSMAFRGREVLGEEFLWNYMSFLGVPFDVMSSWWAANLGPGLSAFNSYGLSGIEPRLVHLAISDDSFPISLPTVQSGPLSETQSLTGDNNYLTWLSTASIKDVQAENYPTSPAPTALLYKVLRATKILEYARLASDHEVASKRLTREQLREREVLGMPEDNRLRPRTNAAPADDQAVGIWDLFARCSIPAPSKTWADYLDNPPPPPPLTEEYLELSALRGSLENLAGLPTAELDRLFTETLDACSHRLDVWATAVATNILKRRLWSLEQGLGLGAYGWQEEVRPASQIPTISGTELEQVEALDVQRAKTLNTPSDLPAPLQPPPDNGGYIYAHSPAQAAVAAILRSAYLSHRGTNQEQSYSIDLSSERVRKALYLLDGVRQGQSLNVLLGYLFESGLKDLGLQKYTQAFRCKFPIVGTQPAPTPTDRTEESVGASNIVDGLALRTAWDKGKKFEVGNDWGYCDLPSDQRLYLPAPDQPDDQTSVRNLLEIIDDYAGALGDISIAEAVFQIVRGNFTRSSSLMDAISRGDRPPDPEVITTPHSGIDVTHRVMVLFGGAPQANSSWAQRPLSRRAMAEPWLDAWLGQLLPNPARFAAQVRYTDQNGIAQTSPPIKLSELSIGPLDLIAMSDSTDQPGNAEIDNRFIFKAIPANACEPTVLYDSTDITSCYLPVPDIMYLAQSLRAFVSACRPLAGQDLMAADNQNDPNTGADELRCRAKSLIKELGGEDGKGGDLATLQRASSPADIRNALFQCSYYGVTGSIPLSSGGDDPNLSTQQSSVVRVLTQRLNDARSVDLSGASVSTLLGVFQSILGKDFVAMPRFALASDDWTSLHNAFGQSSSLVATDPGAPWRWLLQLTFVRPALSKMDSAMTLARVLGNAAGSGGSVNWSPPDLLLGQLPEVDKDTWLGLTIDPSNPPDRGRVALACISQGDPIGQNNYAGLMVDHWVERIPSTNEMAAAAFHYGENRAQAPQALLLGVCPDARPNWDDELITAILEEAFELAKIRTVDLDSLQKVGGILPALYFPINPQKATVSTSFS